MNTTVRLIRHISFIRAHRSSLVSHEYLIVLLLNCSDFPVCVNQLWKRKQVKWTNPAIAVWSCQVSSSVLSVFSPYCQSCPPLPSPRLCRSSTTLQNCILAATDHWVSQESIIKGDKLKQPLRDAAVAMETGPAEKENIMGWGVWERLMWLTPPTVYPGTLP